MKTKELIEYQFKQLKGKYNFSCGLIEENLDEHYSMVFDSEKNCIVYDCNRIEEVFKQGSDYGVFKFDFSTFILFCLVHELGHYLDYQEDRNAFCCKSKEEYIQMELRGINKAMQIIPQELTSEFKEFNQLVIDSYRRDLPNEISFDWK